MRGLYVSPRQRARFLRHERDVSFSLLERILVTEDWRHTRLRARFVKFLTRNRKRKAETAARAAAEQPKVLRRRQR